MIEPATLPSATKSDPTAVSQRATLGVLLAALMLAVLGFAEPVTAQPAAQAGPATTLFQNVRIFDGKSPRLSAASNVLVRGNVIERISTAAIAPEADTRVIDGGGRTLMPGLIDNHWHMMFVRPSPLLMMSADVGYLNLLAGAEANATLLRGFTTVRDVGGPVFSLKRAIDEGLVTGPRIYPSGAMITVTSGHGDFRSLTDLPRAPGQLTRGEIIGGMALVDSPDEMRMRTREQLMQGASQIKLTAGGGVSSPFSPLDVVTFTPAEVRAAVEAARNWGTYVVAHAFTDETVRQSIDAGALCIEHAFLMSEDTAKLIADRGIWLSLQPLPDELRTNLPVGSVERAKADEVFPHIATAYELAKKYKIKTAWGTDVLFSQALAQRQGAILASLGQWYSPPEALIMATSTNAELLRLSGKRNPYPLALGVVEQGAYADMLLVDGNPLENLNLVADPANFVIIMKDGRVFKDTLNR
jgi:imidazolonepropionase-like amidohydrolase